MRPPRKARPFSFLNYYYCNMPYPLDSKGDVEEAGEDDEEEEEEIHEEDGDDAESASRQSYDGSINHASLYEWLQKWTKEYGVPAVTSMGAKCK